MHLAMATRLLCIRTCDASGHAHDTKFVFLYRQSYWASYITIFSYSFHNLRLICLNFQTPLHFLHCSKGVKALKYKVAMNKLVGA